MKRYISFILFVSLCLNSFSALYGMRKTIESNDSHKLGKSFDLPKNSRPKKELLGQDDVTYNVLPDELLYEIFSYLKPQDLKNCRLVNKACNRLIKSTFIKKIGSLKELENARLKVIYRFLDLFNYKKTKKIIEKLRERVKKHGHVYFLYKRPFYAKESCIFKIIPYYIETLVRTEKLELLELEKDTFEKKLENLFKSSMRSEFELNSVLHESAKKSYFNYIIDKPHIFSLIVYLIYVLSAFFPNPFLRILCVSLISCLVSGSSFVTGKMFIALLDFISVCFLAHRNRTSFKAIVDDEKEIGLEEGWKRLKGVFDIDKVDQDVLFETESMNNSDFETVVNMDDLDQLDQDVLFETVINITELIENIEKAEQKSEYDSESDDQDSDDEDDIPEIIED